MIFAEADPLVVGVVGILAGAFGAILSRLWDYWRDKSSVNREDSIRREGQAREDAFRRDAQEREDKLRLEAQARDDKIRADTDLRDACVQFILASDLLYDEAKRLLELSQEELAKTTRPDLAQVRQCFTVLVLIAPTDILLAADELFTTLYDWTAIAEGGTPYTSGLPNRGNKRDDLVEKIRAHFYPDEYMFPYLRSPT